jgi:hypothetical protein
VGTDVSVLDGLAGKWIAQVRLSCCSPSTDLIDDSGGEKPGQGAMVSSDRDTGSTSQSRIRLTASDEAAVMNARMQLPLPGFNGRVKVHAIAYLVIQHRLAIGRLYLIKRLDGGH